MNKELFDKGLAIRKSVIERQKLDPGAILVEVLRAAGYDDDYAGPVTAASSMIGPLVPPSIPMVLYGVIANTSIGALFLAWEHDRKPWLVAPAMNATMWDHPATRASRLRVSMRSLSMSSVP